MNAPLLRVVSGHPSDAEVAVLAAVITSVGGDEATAPPLRGRWNDPAAQHRRAWLPGPGGWRAAVR